MLYSESDIYLLWRRETHATQIFSESAPGPLPERWLQQAWRHQRLDRSRLRTDDGRRVRVLHPGFWNRGAGPDFRDAIVSMDGAPAIRGAIEVDLDIAGWRRHGHDRNPAFRDVILRVVWSAPSTASEPDSPPVLALEDALDTPLQTLGPWLEEEAPLLLPQLLTGRCSGPLAALPAKVVSRILEQAADVRLRRKSEEFAARAGVVGWNRALWEGVLAALGYRNNHWPMRRVAEVLDIDGSSRSWSALEWEVRLLGVGGFLEAGARRRESDRVRELWHLWWRIRDSFHGELLPAFAWHSGRNRPLNQPERRLIVAAQWLASRPLADILLDWIADGKPARSSDSRLWERLKPDPDGFWDHHWTLRTTQNEKVGPLLGRPRFTDLAMNIFLPWLHAQATASGRPALCSVVRERYHRWPKGEDNAVLRLARQRLAGNGPTIGPRTAATQQALLQIARDFCGHSDALCRSCRFPAMVRRWAETPANGTSEGDAGGTDRIESGCRPGQCPEHAVSHPCPEPSRSTT